MNPLPRAAWIPRSRTTRAKLALLSLMGLVLVLAAYLRFTVIDDSLVMSPYQADAAEYYNYAYNLRHHGVYSGADAELNHGTLIPGADAIRPPAYPLFLTPFAAGPHDRIGIRHIAYAQACAGVLTVLLVFWILDQLGRPRLAVAAATLTAISPQLVNACAYMVGETLFALLTVLTIYLLCMGFRKASWSLLCLLLAGLVGGLATMVRPALQYLILCLPIPLLAARPRRRSLNGAAMIILGALLVWGPWIGRNYVDFGASGEGAQLHDALYQGGKPLQLWSWDEDQGTHDIFIYPTLLSPYNNHRFLFLTTHAFMRGLQWPLLVLALLGCIYVFLPSAGGRFEEPALLPLRMMSMLFLYENCLLALGPPFMRYSIPLLPVVFIMGLIYLQIVYAYAVDLRQRSRVRWKQRTGRSP
ncbi:MAG TPA: glycosyltransferase family 39 protein [Gammaproteobacteria bacterium]|nr:glycosyltransferase family 39 protein [Gammaproteobacteria bacterium]